MNILNLMPAFAGTNAPTYNLDGETDITVVRGGGSPITVGIVINDATYGGDGTINKWQEASSGQIDTATDWVIPNDLLGYKTVHARATNNGSAFDGSSASAGTWYRIDTGTEVRYTITVSAIGLKTLNFDLELSFDGGTTVHVGPATYSGVAQLV